MRFQSLESVVLLQIFEFINFNTFAVIIYQDIVFAFILLNKRKNN